MRYLACILALIVAGVCTAADRPNVVWISCEDISSHLGCYGDPNATTPNLDAFAAEGTRFDKAFTCHGVCAPCRTGIITGMSPISLGANHMRSKATLPPHVRCFPTWLREAGYYCTNNSKTDYNFKWDPATVWDESSRKAHWKNRLDGQPFFAVFNLTMTHESKIWPDGWKKVVQNLPADQLHDPESIIVPELYPNTPKVRAAHARLLDIITVMDLEVGRRLQEIEDAGLSDNTIVIFWSDHGNGFPRAKRWIYDSGTLVPMIARIPAGLRVDGQGVPGSVDDRLINLIDLGPTVLNLVGLPIPKHMAGRPFLGPDLPPARDYIHGARDRVDERMDLVRSVRDDRYRYVRNLMPWRAALQHIGYSERSVVRKEMRRLEAAGELPIASAQFLRAPRAPEELYDLQSDPWEVNNLVNEPAYAETLNRLRDECDRWQLTSRDAHLIAEPLLDAGEARSGSRWALLNGANGEARSNALLAIAKAAANPTPAAITLLRASVKDSDPAVRWWAITGLGRLTNVDGLSEVFETAARDPDAAVAVAGAAAVARHVDFARGCEALAKHLKNNSQFIQYAAILELDEFGPEAVRIALPAIKAVGKDGYPGRLKAHALTQVEDGS
jgi:arylsulfatase A-like enzyme